MTSFKFLHTADIHLDSPLKGLSGQEGLVAERIRGATREAFDQLVTQAIQEQVDFLIIAGDLYDGDWRDYRTGLFFVRQMGRLRQAAIAVYLLHGNHDAESQLTRRLGLPDNVHVFTARKPCSFILNEHEVALHGQSFQQRNVSRNLALDYPDPAAGRFNIGVLHTGLGGMGGHENYAPCSLNDLLNKGYDYWALGHVHQREVLHQRPHVVFPGNLQGRHVRETGPKGASLVCVEDGEIVDLSDPAFDVVRWAVLPVPVQQASSLGEVIDCMRDVLDQAVNEQAQGRLLACRLLLQGRTAVHDLLLAAEDELLAEARATALGLGEEVAWVEKVKIETEPLTVDSGRPEESALGDLQGLLQDAASDAGLLLQLQEDLGAMLRQLPHEVRSDSEDPLLQAAIEGNPALLIEAVRPYLCARLTREED